MSPVLFDLIDKKKKIFYWVLDSMVRPTFISEIKFQGNQDMHK